MPSNPAYFSFCGDVTASRAAQFALTFARVMEDRSPVKGAPDHAFILFHSRGYEAKPAQDLHLFLRERADQITVINIGYVCSAALTMFLAVPRERRLMAEHAVFMCHDIRQEVEGVPNEQELIEFEKDRIEDSQFVRKVILRETTIQPERWDCASQFGAEIWCDCDDAIKCGIVSQVGGFRIPTNVSITEL